jgi:hypothetical protein
MRRFRVWERPKLLRKHPPDEAKIIAKHRARIGDVLWEWNALHAQLYAIFNHIMNEMLSPFSIGDRATPVWHLSNTDEAKRKLLLAMAQEVLPPNGYHGSFRRLKWTIAQIDQIATFRNIAAHLPLEFVSPAPGHTLTVIPALAVQRGYWLRMTLSDKYPKFWETIAADLYALQQYAAFIRYHLEEPRAPWPYKPRMRSLPSIQAVNTQVGSLLKPPKRDRPRRASKRKRKSS